MNPFSWISDQLGRRSSTTEQTEPKAIYEAIPYSAKETSQEKYQIQEQEESKEQETSLQINQEPSLDKDCEQVANDSLDNFDLLMNANKASQLAWWQTNKCLKRRSVTLLLGTGAEKYLFSHNFKIDYDNSLQHDELSEKAVDLLSSNLPRIRQLFICMTKVESTEMDQVDRLLRLWSGRLSKLTLVIRYSKLQWDHPDEVTSALLLRLVATLNSMTALKWVAFHLDGYFFPASETEQHLYMPFLARLKTCYLHSADDAMVMLQSLKHFFGRHRAARNLFILNSCNAQAGKRLLKFNPLDALFFRNLNLFGWKQMNESALRRLGDHFQGLTNISLQLDKVTLPKMSQCLQSLKTLTVLALRVNNLPLHLEAIRERNFQLESSEHGSLASLSTVKCVDIHLIDTCRTHAYLKALHFEQIVPNLEQLYICGNCQQCAECGDFGKFGGRERRPQDKTRVDVCIQLMTAPIVPLYSRLRVMEPKYFGCT